MFPVAFGFTIFFASIVSISSVTMLLIKFLQDLISVKILMHVVIALNLFITYSLTFLVAYIFIKKTNLINRLPEKIPGVSFIYIGGFFIILPLFLQIFTSMIEGGGASYTLIQLSAPFTIVAKPLLVAGIIKPLMSVSPQKQLR